MKNRFAFVPATLAILTTACGMSSESSSSPKLIGGTAVDPLSSQQQNIYPATVQIWGNCTAAKIAPKKFLTAAHCVLAGDQFSLNATAFNPMYFTGSKIYVTTDKNPVLNPFVKWHTLTVSVVSAHPNFGDGCPTRFQCDFAIPSKNGPDIAVVEVLEDTPQIQIASVDFTPVGLGERMVVTGYGCEVGVSIPVNYVGRFKSSIADSRGLDEVASRTSSTPASFGNTAFWNIATPGMGVEPSAASLCPGDSGGPLYRDNGTQKTIVGVNAYYAFSPRDVNGISMYNWHTRTSAVKSWLEPLLR